MSSICTYPPMLLCVMNNLPAKKQNISTSKALQFPFWIAHKEVHTIKWAFLHARGRREMWALPSTILHKIWWKSGTIQTKIIILKYCSMLLFNGKSHVILCIFGTSSMIIPGCEIFTLHIPGMSSFRSRKLPFFSARRDVSFSWTTLCLQ